MYLQVTNTTKEKFNQIKSTKETLIKDIKAQGWVVQDCKVKEVRESLVQTIYRGADGKTVPNSR